MTLPLVPPRADMRKDVQNIFKCTPRTKQVMMFSATLKKEIRPICKKFMRDVCGGISTCAKCIVWLWWIPSPFKGSCFLRGCACLNPLSA